MPNKPTDKKTSSPKTPTESSMLSKAFSVLDTVKKTVQDTISPETKSPTLKATQSITQKTIEDLKETIDNQYNNIVKIYKRLKIQVEKGESSRENLNEMFELASTIQNQIKAYQKNNPNQNRHNVLLTIQQTIKESMPSIHKLESKILSELKEKQELNEKIQNQTQALSSLQTLITQEPHAKHPLIQPLNSIQKNPESTSETLHQMTQEVKKYIESLKTKYAPDLAENLAYLAHRARVLKAISNPEAPLTVNASDYQKLHKALTQEVNETTLAEHIETLLVLDKELPQVRSLKERAITAVDAFNQQYPQLKTQSSKSDNYFIQNNTKYSMSSEENSFALEYANAHLKITAAIQNGDSTNISYSETLETIKQSDLKLKPHRLLDLVNKEITANIEASDALTVAYREKLITVANNIKEFIQKPTPATENTPHFNETFEEIKQTYHFFKKTILPLVNLIKTGLQEKITQEKPNILNNFNALKDSVKNEMNLTEELYTKPLNDILEYPEELAIETFKERRSDSNESLETIKNRFEKEVDSKWNTLLNAMKKKHSLYVLLDQINEKKSACPINNENSSPLHALNHQYHQELNKVANNIKDCINNMHVRAGEIPDHLSKITQIETTYAFFKNKILPQTDTKTTELADPIKKEKNTLSIQFKQLKPNFQTHIQQYFNAYSQFLDDFKPQTIAIKMFSTVIDNQNVEFINQELNAIEKNFKQHIDQAWKEKQEAYNKEYNHYINFPTYQNQVFQLALATKKILDTIEQEKEHIINTDGEKDPRLTILNQMEKKINTDAFTIFNENEKINPKPCLYAMAQLPDDYAIYPNSYIYCNNNKNPKLYYVRPNSTYEEVTITDFSPIETLKTTLSLNPKKGSPLSKEQVQDLITLNGGHTPSVNIPKRNEIIKLSEISKKIKTDILSNANLQSLSDTTEKNELIKFIKQLIRIIPVIGESISIATSSFFANKTEQKFRKTLQDFKKEQPDESLTSHHKPGD